MLRVGLGHAEGIDFDSVMDRVISDCRTQMGEQIPGAGIVFAGPHLEHARMLAAINEAFPGIGLVGCSTSGNFSSLHGLGDDAVTLCVLGSDLVEFSVGLARNISADYRSGIQDALSSARAALQGAPSLCLTFPDWYSVPSFEPEEVLELLDTGLGPNCPVFGGVAGVLWSEPSAFLQFCNSEILTDGMPILLMSGPVQHAFSIANSWRPVGRRTVVTSVKGRRIYSIGESSAVEYYRHYLGYHEEPAREFILAVYEPGSEQYYICSPVDYHEDGSITFTGVVPENSEVQLTEATRDQLVEDTISTTRSLRDGDRSWEPALALNFSCAFRKTMLGTSAGKELDALRQTFDPEIPSIGFFSFGEIAPLVYGGPSRVQGATLVTLLIGPKSEKTTLPEPKVETVPKEPLAGDPRYADYLERKLRRSEVYRERLEFLKDFTTQMHHQMMDEVEQARQQIQEKEEKIRESEEKYRRIVQTAGEGFLLMDKGLTIIDANDAFCRLMGYERSELLERSSLDLVLQEETQLFESNFISLSGTGYQRFEGTLLSRRDKRIPVLVHSSILRDDDDLPIGYMAFFADLSEQKKALALAGEVQKSLLPQGNPQVAGLDIAGRNMSCEEVGGDYYDFFLQQDQSRHAFSVAVGDITGHGVDAALLMTSARAFLRLHVTQNESVASIVEAMNRHLVDDVLETGRFMTLFYLCIHADLKSLEWVRAGHDPAILYDPATGACEELKGPGMVLGFDPEFVYESNVKTGLGDNNIIAIGTDGIWETSNNDGELFGRKRFQDLLHEHSHLPAADILNTVFAELETFRGGRKAEDDITLVIIKIKA